MKKHFFVLAAILVLFPLTASADLVGDAQMAVDKVGTTTINVGSATWYSDYEYTSFSDPDGDIQPSTEEVYCISRDALDRAEVNDYSFYTAENDNLNNEAALITWLANYGLANNAKTAAQGAIWYTLGISTNTDYQSLIDEWGNLNVEEQDDYINEWLVGITPSSSTQPGNGQDGSQDFLVQVNSVPEPAATALIGFGILGLAAMRRRTKDNN